MKTAITKTKLKVKEEPVWAAALLIAVALTAAGVVVDANTVYLVITAALPLISAHLTRKKVSPVGE